MNESMDTSADSDADAAVGTVSTPRSQTPAPTPNPAPPTPFRPTISPALQTFMAPARERGAAKTPSKFTALKKRTRAPENPETQEENQEGTIPAPQNAPPAP